MHILAETHFLSCIINFWFIICTSVVAYGGLVLMFFSVYFHVKKKKTKTKQKTVNSYLKDMGII